MTAKTYAMNNGEDTWVFTINGETAQVEKINCAGVIITIKKITTREQARKFWADGFRLCPHLMRQGDITPATCEIYPEYAYVMDEADEPMPFGVR